MTDEQRIARLNALYDRIPKMKDCIGKCEDSCTVIPCTVGEKKRIEAHTGQEFKPLGLPPMRVRCSALKDGRCTVYELRPAICRAFGTVNHPFMKCEHGCVPERWISGMELYEIMNEVEKLMGEMQVPDVPGWHKLSEGEAMAAAALLRER